MYTNILLLLFIIIFRDLNIHVIGVVEQDGEDCISITCSYITLLGLEDDVGKVENAHHTGRKPSNAIAG